ncbi:MAG: hypothetical protein WKG01_33190 [Kofleriaceae bacterium]
MRCIVWLVVVACSSRPGDPRQPTGSATAALDASIATTPSEGECSELVTHAIDIGVAEQRAQLPPDQVPTQSEQEQLATELRGQFLPACLRGAREAYRCAIASKTLTELAGCQATPSSSTSNSSVAPPGIAPPAPAAP